MTVIKPTAPKDPAFRVSNAAEWGFTGSPKPPEIGVEGEESHRIQERGSHSDIPAHKFLPGRGPARGHGQETAGSLVGSAGTCSLTSSGSCASRAPGAQTGTELITTAQA